MRKRPRADDYDTDKPMLPSLTVYEPEGGLKRPIGFLIFPSAKHAKVSRVRRTKGAAKTAKRR